MNGRLLPLGVLAFASFPAGVLAEEPPIIHQVLNRSSQIGIGLAGDSIKTDSPSTDTRSLVSFLRKPLGFGK